MKFGLIAAVGLGLVSAAPSALYQEKEERSLDKRLGPFGLAVVGGVAAAVMGKVIEQFQGKKRAEQTWDGLREGLLGQLVQAMDDASESDEATICARHGEYAINDWFKVTDRATITANTDGLEDLFDCFFITGPSTVVFLNGTSSVDVGVSAGPCTYADDTVTCS